MNVLWLFNAYNPFINDKNHNKIFKMIRVSIKKFI
jgi:hypothetical protein